MSTLDRQEDTFNKFINQVKEVGKKRPVSMKHTFGFPLSLLRKVP